MQRDYTVNRTIRDFLQENGIHPDAVADGAGIPRDVFRRMLRCKRVIYAEELIPIVNASGISLDAVVAAVSR